MENKSILDTILNTAVQEEAAILDSHLILFNLFNTLREKEQDILEQRFGLKNEEKATLEAIGQAYNLTRERIRQIENAAVAKLKKHDDFNRYISSLKHIINSLLEEHGGIVERQYLIDNLSYLSFLANSEQQLALDVLRNHYDFILSKLLTDDFDHVKENGYYNNLWKLKFVKIDHMEELLKFILNKMENIQTVLPTQEVIKLVKDNDIYIKNQDKFQASNNFDISPVIKNDRFSDNYDLINENKALYSLLRSSKQLQQNKFGFWGINKWPEITPKTINHKIYLILKHEGKPLHFKEIAERINEISFDHKKANPATVHNELILDNKYVLIGRGIYALKEWGYKTGTVTDVVAEALQEANKPLTKNEIVERVLDKRLVKKATINLALMDKERFSKEGNKYKLVS
ncbi:MAG: sigma factor-like helix-turn-helix DNA-binding protein [Candidatus Falkowbacteria bacterium]